MGWASTADYVQATRLAFGSREEAVRFAERQGWRYRVEEPKKVVVPPKNYGELISHGWDTMSWEDGREVVGYRGWAAECRAGRQLVSMSSGAMVSMVVWKFGQLGQDCWTLGHALKGDSPEPEEAQVRERHQAGHGDSDNARIAVRDDKTWRAVTEKRMVLIHFLLRSEQLRSRTRQAQDLPHQITQSPVASTPASAS